MNKVTLLILFIILSACKHDEHYIKGEWLLNCYYNSGNIITGLSGRYKFEAGIFTANLQTCSEEANNELNTFSFSAPYSIGKSVDLGNGLESRVIEFYINELDVVPALLYKHERQIYWSWGINNESINHSVFGFIEIDGLKIWGGYPVYELEEKLLPVFENFPEIQPPTTVSFETYLERKNG